MGLFSWAKSFVWSAKEAILSASGLSQSEKKQIIQKLEKLASREVNILLVGGTGVGKSSTINALFKTDNRRDNPASVGTGPNPETQEIHGYTLGENLVIWDSPGLGESPAADLRHIREINQMLQRKDNDGHYLIDLVLVVLDAGTRDYDSTFRALDVIKTSIKDPQRVVIGLNKIEMVAGGRGWDHSRNIPTPKLQTRIDEKIDSIRRRVRFDSNISWEPIAYSAGRADDGFGGSEPYQIPELLCRIISAVPEEKRFAVIEKAKTEVINSTTPQQRQRIQRDTSSFAERTLGRIAVGVIGGLVGGFFGGCYITTAVCQYLGKSDHCHMLNTFRHFRDHWLTQQVNGKALIFEYYREAPKIVLWIQDQPNQDQIYTAINQRYLRPCYRLLKHRKYRECFRLYTQMVRDLQRQSNRSIK